MKIILGSKSPRRQEILKQAEIEFEVHIIEVDEHVKSFTSPKDYVLQIADKKGEIYHQTFPNDLVICADTIVVIDDKILGKPKNHQEAYEMIKTLQGRTHQVLTAVSLRQENKAKTFVASTDVVITSMTDSEISSYINTTEPYDKAGAYAIQGLFSKYVLEIKGDYYNVMGLPISLLYQELKNFI